MWHVWTILVVSGGSKKGTFEVDLFKVLTIKGLADEKLVLLVLKGHTERAICEHLPPNTISFKVATKSKQFNSAHASNSTPQAVKLVPSPPTML